MITGFHHLTAITSNAAKNVAFYTKVLGLKLVKQTVNFDDPGSWHLYFGNEVGAPGTIITFFEWSHLAKGIPGIGGTHHLAFRVKDKMGLLKWKRWLIDLGYSVSGPYNRTYFESIYTQDPDGLIIEIATEGPGFTVDESFETLGEKVIIPVSERTKELRDSKSIESEIWSEPIHEISIDMSLHNGLHHVSAIGTDLYKTDAFYQEMLGFRRVKRTQNFDDTTAPHWYWGNKNADLGSIMTYFEYKPGTYRPVKMGTGSTHHIAFSTPNNETQLQMRDKLLSAGYRVSPVMERNYFRSIYFNDPDGHILEIATAGPGFAIDETLEELGTQLKLPENLESYRNEIESHLSSLNLNK